VKRFMGYFLVGFVIFLLLVPMIIDMWPPTAYKILTFVAGMVLGFCVYFIAKIGLRLIGK